MLKLASVFIALALSLGVAKEPQPFIGTWLAGPDVAEQENLLLVSGRSLLAANEFLKFQNEPQFFCFPPGASLDGSNYRMMLVDMIKKHPEVALRDISSFEPFLLLAIRNAFPCSDQKQAAPTITP